MSELVVFVFRDEYRAPEVLNELRRRNWEWIEDLDDAMAVTLDNQGKAKVHLSVDLSKNVATIWARMWASLLGATLFTPLTDVLVNTAEGLAQASNGRKHPPKDFPDTFPDTHWWEDCAGIPEDFTRDVAGAIAPGGSAIFMLLRRARIPVALGQLRNYGDTLIHTSLGREQDNRMQAMLASR